MSYTSENRALKRLSELTWKAEELDDFVTMMGYFTPGGAESISRDLGEETRAALGFSLIANHTKVMLRRSLAEKIFALEGLPPLNIQTAVRAR
jgi:hypothetical protein